MWYPDRLNAIAWRGSEGLIDATSKATVDVSARHSRGGGNQSAGGDGKRARHVHESSSEPLKGAASANVRREKGLPFVCCVCYSPFRQYKRRIGCEYLFSPPLP